MAAPQVAVVGLGLCAAQVPDLVAWRQGRRDAAAQPTGACIDARQRRRTSVLAKAMADAYAEASDSAGCDRRQVAAVFGSAFGEVSTMIGLLDQMWSEEGTLSPMRFVASVHNAASGTVSIATQNQGFTTSLSADYDTPAMALLEGIGWVLSHGEPTIVVCGDEPIPLPVDAQPGGAWSLLAGAVALAPLGMKKAPRLALTMPQPTSLSTPQPTLAAGLSPAALPAEFASNPCAGMLDLIEALCQQRQGTLRLDRGAGRGYLAQLEQAIA